MGNAIIAGVILRELEVHHLCTDPNKYKAVASDLYDKYFKPSILKDEHFLCIGFILLKLLFMWGEQHLLASKRDEIEFNCDLCVEEQDAVGECGLEEQDACGCKRIYNILQEFEEIWQEIPIYGKCSHFIRYEINTLENLCIKKCLKTNKEIPSFISIPQDLRSIKYLLNVF